MRKLMKMLGYEPIRKTEIYRFEKTVSEARNSEDLHKIALLCAKHPKERTMKTVDHFGQYHEWVEVYIEVVK